jgi:hypothetical protein
MKPTTRSISILILLGIGMLIAFAQSNSTKDKEITGCLSQAASEYVLTIWGPGVKNFQLLGNTAPLAVHVGHSITVTGELVLPALDTFGMPSGTARDGNWFAVGTADGRDTGTILMKSFEDISERCDQSTLTTAVP